MQKVAWPITIVSTPRVMFVKPKKLFSATPVMTPGRAIGSTSRNETPSRPKNRKLCSAYDTAEPSTRAMPAANTPTLTDSKKAWRTAGSCHATANQCQVKPRSGQVWTTDGPNAYTMISRMGVNSSSSTTATQMRSAIRRPAGSTSDLPERAERPGREQIAGHDRDRDHRHGCREWQIVRDADVRFDHVPDQDGVPAPDEDWRDVVPRRQGEGEDRAC